MVISSLSHRGVRFGIKNGFTFADFCHKYNCTQVEFEERIQGIYKYDAKKMLDSIRANTKRKDRQSHSAPSSPTPAINETTELFLNNDCEITTTSILPDSQSQLKILKQQEQTLSDRVIYLESQHKAIAQQHRGHIRELRDLHAELETLRQAFEEKATAYDITLNETGSDVLFSTLRDRDDLEELRVKDIKILSRVLAIINNSEMRIVPMFENAALDSCFQTFNNPPPRTDITPVLQRP